MTSNLKKKNYKKKYESKNTKSNECDLTLSLVLEKASRITQCVCFEF